MRQPFFSNIVNEEKVVIAPEQGKTPVTISSDDVCAEHAFLYFLPKGKFGCNAPRDITISSDGYFDQNQIKIIYITDLLGNVIVRLPHPRSGNSLGQETFLAPLADKQTRNHGTECLNHNLTRYLKYIIISNKLHQTWQNNDLLREASTQTCNFIKKETLA